MSKVLIAEDDLLVADMLEDVLVGGGYDVCGIARTVDQAVELGERYKPDLAILDIRLAEGGLGTEIPGRLTNAGHMGILYASGHALPQLTKADGAAVIMKPYRPTDILRAVGIVKQVVETGATSQPFPERFILLNGSHGTEQAPDMIATESKAVQRLLRQQAALAQFGTYAFSATDVHAVLTEAARVCAEGLGVNFCKICRYRPDENDLLIEAGVGWHAGVVGQVVSQADASSPQGRAYTSGSPVIITNLLKEPTLIPPPFYADHKIISTVDVVIQGQERNYGILEVDNPAEHIYDEYDINFLTGFANILAGAIETAKRSAANSATIAEKDRLLTVQRALLNEKGVLARELNHRVRNNLQLIHGMLEREIKSCQPNTNGNNGMHGFEAITRRIIALSRVYDHLLGTGLQQKVDVSDYLTSLCSSLTSIEAAKHPDIKITYNLARCPIDLDIMSALGLVVTELLANCFEHAFPDGQGSIHISLAVTPLGEKMILTIRDDGVGFPTLVNGKRNGIGLVKRLIEQLDGTTTLRSDLGTEWVLTIPTAAATSLRSRGPSLSLDSQAGSAPA